MNRPDNSHLFPQRFFVSIYNAEISAGSLMPLESKRLAALLLSQVDEPGWKHAVEVENILQKNSPATARRQARLIRRRLETLDATGLQMIADRESEVRLQLLLAASIKHSTLLGDFLRNVYGLRQRQLEPSLSKLDWLDFLEECTHQDASVADWSETTRAKLFQVIVRILVEAKYLESSRNLKLTPRALHPDVRRYLHERKENYVLDCMDRTS